MFANKKYYYLSFIILGIRSLIRSIQSTHFPGLVRMTGREAEKYDFFCCIFHNQGGHGRAKGVYILNFIDKISKNLPTGRL